MALHTTTGFGYASESRIRSQSGMVPAISTMPGVYEIEKRPRNYNLNDVFYDPVAIQSNWAIGCSVKIPVQPRQPTIAQAEDLKQHTQQSDLGRAPSATNSRNSSDDVGDWVTMATETGQGGDIRPANSRDMVKHYQNLGKATGSSVVDDSDDFGFGQRNSPSSTEQIILPLYAQEFTDQSRPCSAQHKKKRPLTPQNNLTQGIGRFLTNSNSRFPLALSTCQGTPLNMSSSFGHMHLNLEPQDCASECCLENGPQQYYFRSLGYDNDEIELGDIRNCKVPGADHPSPGYINGSSHLSRSHADKKNQSTILPYMEDSIEGELTNFSHNSAGCRVSRLPFPLVSLPRVAHVKAFIHESQDQVYATAGLSSYESSERHRVLIPNSAAHPNLPRPNIRQPAEVFISAGNEQTTNLEERRGKCTIWYHIILAQNFD
jgi:hypothetical protein